MEKEHYLDIINKIEKNKKIYREYMSGYDGNEKLKPSHQLLHDAIMSEIDALGLDQINLKLTPKEDNDEIVSYVILDREWEYPVIYEMSIDDYNEITRTLYKVYTDYEVNKIFYDEFNISRDSLVSLVFNYLELPIISYKEGINATMNNVRYWTTIPYTEGLLSVVDKDTDEIKKGR